MSEAALRSVSAPDPDADAVTRFVVTRRLVEHVVAECTRRIREEMTTSAPDLRRLSRWTAVRARADADLRRLAHASCSELDELRAGYVTLADALA